METVREFLTSYLVDTQFLIDPSDEDLRRELVFGVELSRRYHEAHRHYTEWKVVVVIRDRFIEYTDYEMSGDEIMSDRGLSLDIDTARFVRPKQHMVTYYI